MKTIFLIPTVIGINIIPPEAISQSNISNTLVVEPIATYTGGQTALSHYITHWLKPIVDTLNDSIHEKMIVSFVVQPDSTLRDISIVRGVFPELDSLCAQAFEHMDGWIPPIVHGEPREIRMMLPIMISK